MDIKLLNHIDNLLRHIHNVSTNCNLLGKKLIENGKSEIGLILIANGLIHDHSKFFGAEWEYLDSEEKNGNFKLAVYNHKNTNPHHPEYWGGIKEMPNVYLAEMVCDWKARASEMGTDLKQWINESATKKYKFSKRDNTYKKIMEYVDLIIEKFL